MLFRVLPDCATLSYSWILRRTTGFGPSPDLQQLSSCPPGQGQSLLSALRCLLPQDPVMMAGCWGTVEWSVNVRIMWFSMWVQAAADGNMLVVSQIEVDTTLAVSMDRQADMEVSETDRPSLRWKQCLRRGGRFLFIGSSAGIWMAPFFFGGVSELWGFEWLGSCQRLWEWAKMDQNGSWEADIWLGKNISIYLESTASIKTGAGTNGVADFGWVWWWDNQLSGSRNVQAVGTRFAFVVVVERPWLLLLF